MNKQFHSWTDNQTQPLRTQKRYMHPVFTAAIFTMPRHENNLKVQQQMNG